MNKKERQKITLFAQAKEVCGMLEEKR